MKTRDQKLAILRLLGREPEPITLLQLKNNLKLNYTSRTIRRWLNELIEEGLVKKLGITKSSKYVSIKAQSRTDEHVSGCFGTESLVAIKEISKPLFERLPVTYNDDWLDSYKPNISFYLSEELREQLQKSGQRTESQEPAGTYAHQIFDRLLIDLSYNSSRLEGNTYSLLDTKRLLLHGDSAEGKLDEEKVMILNHKEAIRYLVDNVTRINADLNAICTLHYLLADGLVEPKYAGKVRDYGVRIGGSTYIPFEDSKRLQLQLEKIAEKATKILNPFEQSLFLVTHISYLQAFVDVNKRTARLSANISLITKNLVPHSFNDVSVEDYMSAMIAIYELQDVRPLVDLYAYSYIRTCAAYDSTVKALGFDEVRIRYRQQRREIIRDVILRGMSKSVAQTYIEEESRKEMPKEDQKAFVKNANEDLEQMDQSRISGLGITPEQLNEWIRRYWQN